MHKSADVVVFVVKGEITSFLTADIPRTRRKENKGRKPKVTTLV